MKKFFIKIASALHINGRGIPVFLVSLLLAFSMWLVYNLSLRYQEYLTVPIVAKCNIEGHAAQSTNQCDVVARGRATGYSIVRIRGTAKNRAVVIPFEKIYPSKTDGEIFYVTVAEVQEYVHHIFGESTSIDYFLTDTLYFRFPYETCKTVAVRAVHNFDFADQYTMVGKVDVTPDSVTIYGEPYKLNRIEYVYTDPINATRVDSDIHGVAKLEKIKDIRISEGSVQYSASVERYIELSETVSIGVKNVPGGKQFRVYPSTARVRFRVRFPYKTDPFEGAEFYVDYNDFLDSRTGQCIIKTEGISSDVIDYVITPEVYECVVNDR